MRETEAEELRDRRLVESLLAWFETAARSLPWRKTRDPYAIWLSEVMLQQTRVDTVIPYYHRFLERFPNVRKLSEAPLDQVLSMWSGLGYYRRARVLHAAAREVTEKYGGAMPKSAAGLRELPGVGAYTAGAVASIAYGERAPLVDGNVVRVFSRLFCIDAPASSSEATKRFWAIATRLVPEENPGRFNEALMELGATVCTPRSPRCEACPVAMECQARATNRVEELPVITKKKPVPVVKMVSVAIERNGKLLFARRAEGGLFGGLWELPMIESPSLAKAPSAFERAGFDLGAVSLKKIGSVRHVLSHRVLSVSVTKVASEQGREPRFEGVGETYDRVAWLDAAALSDVGVSTLARKIARLAVAT